MAGKAIGECLGTDLILGKSRFPRSPQVYKSHFARPSSKPVNSLQNQVTGSTVFDPTSPGFRPQDNLKDLKDLTDPIAASLGLISQNNLENPGDNTVASPVPRSRQHLEDRPDIKIPNSHPKSQYEGSIQHFTHLQQIPTLDLRLLSMITYSRNEVLIRKRLRGSLFFGVFCVAHL